MMSKKNSKISQVLNVKRILRYSFFPNCVIRILEYIEENEFEDEQNNVCDFFHCLLSSLWWQVVMVEQIIYATEKELEKSRYWMVYLTSNYAVCLENLFDQLIKHLENPELQELINANLTFNNAGIIFSSFTEYRALAVAARFIINLYGGKVKETTEKVFGEDAILGDINRDDKRLEKWFDEIRERFLSISPPINALSRWEFWLEAESLSYKIGAEFAEIGKVYDVKDRANYSTYRVEASDRKSYYNGNLKKRGAHILEDQVEELLNRLKWPINMTPSEAKKILDTENICKYKPTNVRAIRDTKAWKKLQALKNEA